MNTSTSTATDAPLPAITTIEATVAVASIEAGGDYCVLRLAAQLKLPPDELLDILARPHVIAFTEAARQFMQMRAGILARGAWITSLQNLAEVAKNDENDVNTRLRAAIAILHGVREGPAPASSSRSRPLSADSRARPPRLSLPAPKSPPASSPAPPATHIAPERPRPEPTTKQTAPRTPPSELPAHAGRAPNRLQIAAGAPRARHGIRVDSDCNTDRHLPGVAASTPAPDRPP